MASTKDQVIRVSSGAEELTWEAGLIEKKAKDISADTVRISLSLTDAQAGSNWIVPDVLRFPTLSSVMVQMLITPALNLSPGAKYLWVRVTDNPEIVPRCIARFVVA